MRATEKEELGRGTKSMMLEEWVIFKRLQVVLTGKVTFEQWPNESHSMRKAMWLSGPFHWTVKKTTLFNPQGDFYFNLIYVTQFIARMTLPCQGEKIQDLCPLSAKNNLASWSHMICCTSKHFSPRLYLQKWKMFCLPRWFQ